MSLWRIAWSYLWNRKLTTIMTIFSVALGVALISTVLTLREETRKRFEEEGQSFDIVVGAKGNPLQLVLSTVYLLDAPTGNISWADYERLKKEEEVAAAYPIGMGDSFGKFRIVATNRDLFDFEYKGHKPYALAKGEYFDAQLEAVVGAVVAEDYHLELGATFRGTHGFVSVPGALVHKERYTVVGILARSGGPSDRAVFCNMESIWAVHSHGGDDHEEDAEHEYNADGSCCHANQDVTAVLVKLHSPAMRFRFRQRINRTYNAMAAIPVSEIRKLYDQLLGVAKAVLLAIGYLVVVISAITILIGLYMAILQRKRDLAIMRALGASKGEIFGCVLIEAFWVTVLGLVAGWLLGAAVCAGLGVYLTQKLGFYVPAFSMNTDTVTAFSVVLLMGMVAGILPAWQAYRTDIARDLAEL